MKSESRTGESDIRERKESVSNIILSRIMEPLEI